MEKSDITFQVYSDQIKEKGVVSVDLHVSEKTPKGVTNNARLTVFVEAKMNTSLSEIEAEGYKAICDFVDKLQAFLKKSS